ncbi:MAG: tripartite tricarboxylate transporter substrate binding protein [Betaproteobacteria bacterium]|nr:tripartite tricarboxylate transporter substrate binding protein [Betaproteobacteria bacterium]
MKLSRIAVITGALALVPLFAASTTIAQTYPLKPIRLVVPTSVSTPIDIVSRIVADKMSAALGQPIAVDNRPGATGIVGAQEVLKHPADGYTLLTIMMPMSVGQSIYANVPFDLRKDFEPVGQTAFSYNVLVVHPSVPVNSVKELAALMQAKSGKLSFSSGGPGTPAHISGELFKQQTGADALHVPYHQFPQAIGDLLGGQNQFMFAATPPVMGHIAARKLRALAITGPHRISALKDVPTMIEAGYPDFVVREWQGFVVRTGVPRDVITKVNAAIATALATDEVKQLFAKLGADAAAGSPETFAKLIGSEIDRWGKLTKAANITVQ